MQFLKTIKTNIRSILVGVAVVLGVAFLADVVEALATRDGKLIWLANTTQILRGLAVFLAANLSAWIVLATAWPSLNRYGNDRFQNAWRGLPQNRKFYVYVAVACVLTLAAAISFSA